MCIEALELLSHHSVSMSCTWGEELERQHWAQERVVISVLPCVWPAEIGKQVLGGETPLGMKEGPNTEGRKLKEAPA